MAAKRTWATSSSAVGSVNFWRPLAGRPDATGFQSGLLAIFTSSDTGASARCASLASQEYSKVPPAEASAPCGGALATIVGAVRSTTTRK
ncbi:MAG: hypothetical protein ACYTGB_16320 [Planctomycetota bacterium]